MKKKHYIIYKTTNLVNGKIYIGKHETDNLDDGYLGSGKLLRRAIEKYGEHNFIREILFECSSREEMNAKEAELVNEEFLKRDDVYNLKQGGEGGFDYIISNSLNRDSDKHRIGGMALSKKMKEDKGFRDRLSNKVRDFIISHQELYANFRNSKSFLGKKHTEETKAKMREKAKMRVGEKNSAFGTVWIYNESLEQNKMVKKEQANDFLKQGWKLGRKMSFYNN